MDQAPALIPFVPEALTANAVPAPAAPVQAVGQPASFAAQLEAVLLQALAELPRASEPGLGERQAVAFDGRRLPLAEAEEGESPLPAAATAPAAADPAAALAGPRWSPVALEIAPELAVMAPGEVPEPGVPELVAPAREPAPRDPAGAALPVFDEPGAEAVPELPVLERPAAATTLSAERAPAPPAAHPARFEVPAPSAILGGPGLANLAPLVPAVTAAPASSLPATSLPLHAPGWEPTLAERVAWQIGERVQSARLELNPPDLGPLEVRVRFEGEHARVHLVADLPAAREALESGLPRLRELLQQAGIGLLDVSVERHAPGSREPGYFAWTRAQGFVAPDEEAVPVARLAVGLVDDYA